MSNLTYAPFKSIDRPKMCHKCMMLDQLKRGVSALKDDSSLVNEKCTCPNIDTTLRCMYCKYSQRQLEEMIKLDPLNQLLCAHKFI
jgi:hypothetical protein